MPISTEPVPEFSRPVEVAHITAAPAEFPIAADASERSALAERFGLVALGRFTATVSLRRMPRRLYELTATLAAEVTQTCVVTLEPFDTKVSDTFTLLFGAAEDIERLEDEDVDDIELIADGSIDIGEAVAQQLSLVLDPHPHGPGSEVITDKH